MTASWRPVLLSEVADEITVGHVGAMAKRYSAHGIPFLRSQNVRRLRLDLNGVKYIPDDFHQELRKSRLEAGDVVIVRTGDPGACAVIPPELGPANCADLVIIRPGRHLDSHFAAYFINEVGRHHVRSHLVGAVQQHFNVGAARTLPINLPPIGEQRAIAGALRALDNKIEQNRRLEQLLENVARTLFRACFVEYEPVRAKAYGAVSFAAMPQELFDALPTRLVDSDIGLVPEGWSAGCLGDVIDIHDSRRIPLSRREREQRRGSFRYYGATGVLDHVDDYLFDGVFVLVGEDGTVMTERDGPVVQYVWGQFWVNNHAHVLTGASGISTEYLRVLLDHVNIRPFITGAVQAKLNQRNLKSVPVVIPDAESMAAFDAEISPLFALLRQIHGESRLLGDLRDYLLPKLVGGQVRVEVDGG